MTHALGPGPLPASTPTSGAGRSSTCSPGSAPRRPAARRRPRLRARHPRPPCWPSGGPAPTCSASTRRRRWSSGPAPVPRRGAVRARRRARLAAGGPGRRARRRTRPTSGCPATSSCCPGSSATSRPGGWFAFQVPGQPRRAQPRAAARARGRPALRARTPAASPGRSPTTPGCTPARCATSAWPSTPGRRRTCTCSPARTRSSPGSAAPAPGPTLQALPGDLRADFVAEYKALLREAYPPGPHGTTCRSAGSSWSPGCLGPRHEAAPRAGVLPARRRGPAARRFYGAGSRPARGGRSRAALAARVAAGSAGDAAWRCTSGVEEAFAPGPQGPPGVPRWTGPDLDAIAVRLVAAGVTRSTAPRSTTFPGHRRFHTADGNGNRVELLAEDMSQARDPGTGGYRRGPPAQGVRRESAVSTR